MASENIFPVYYKSEQETLLFTLPSTVSIPRIGETVTLTLIKNSSKPTWSLYKVVSIDTQVAFSEDNPQQFTVSKTVTLARQASGLGKKN